jgi:lipoyl(octanoyl) transferase
MVPWQWLGRAELRRVLAQQLAARERVWAGEPGVVLLCEHPPVITLGRSATPANILDAGDVPIERIVVAFLEAVATAIAQACAALGVPGAAWRRDPAGVWLDGKKLAACGIHVARGVSVHGFALDVDTPAQAWRAIRPCGLEVPQISLARALGAAVAVEQVAHEVGPRVARAVSGGAAAV